MKAVRRLCLVTAMALALMTAAWAAPAAASYPQFEGSSYPANISGQTADFPELDPEDRVGEAHVFTVRQNINVVCGVVGLSNTLPGPRNFLFMEADYGLCTVPGISPTLYADVSMKNCDHLFNVDHLDTGSRVNYWGGWDLHCEGSGVDALQIRLAGSEAGLGTNPMCIYDIGEGQFQDGDPYTDLFYEADAEWGYMVHIDVDDVKYTRSGGYGSRLLCGQNNGTGSYHGVSSLGQDGNLAITGG